MLQGLSQLLALSHGNIDSQITGISPGVYELDKGSNGAFTVACVGRADTNLNAILHQYVNRYRFFKYALCSSPQSAFEAECELYHQHKPPDNTIHPPRPEGSGWKCPRCKMFD